MEKKHFFVFFIAVFMQSLMVSFSASPTNITDELALLAFKSLIITNTNNVLSKNWSTNTSFCNWIGVSCSSQRQRVTALSLPNMNLQGTISPSIANLSFLVMLNLGNNSFNGNLPYSLGQLPRLRVINVHNNQLGGNIPPSLFRNQRLQTLSLAHNKFTGDLWGQSWNLPELKILNLSSNDLTGTIHPSIGNISKLERLRLDQNRLNGNIPKEIGNLSHVIELDLSNNQHTGSIPPGIFNISSLRFLSLGNNSLSGLFVPNTENNMLNLETIDFSSNQLSGEIPSLCQFQELRFLYLSRNAFTGQMPRNIGCLSKLESVYLTSNEISGTVPPSLGNISSLQFLGCVENNIGGDIPQELGSLSNLQMLGFDYNNLIGEIPQAIFNISSLVYIAFTANRLSGHIPKNTGLQLPNLEGIFLADNDQLNGEIPTSITNASRLLELELSYNFFTGSVPTNLGDLRQLQFLNLEVNQLTNEPRNQELGFLNSLVECRTLQFIILGNNPINGILPNSVGNLSSSIEMFNMENGQIRGHIPSGIGNLSSILSVFLNGNNLRGKIPSEFGKLKQLQRLNLSRNMLQGPIPQDLCHLIHVGEIVLFGNELSGSIPDCIGNLSRLQKIILGSNNLTSSLPSSLWGVESLLLVNLSHNSLQGELPLEIGKLKAIDELDLSANQFSGEIPSRMGDLKSLRYLSLSNNSFQGPIPPSVGNLISLEFLDLSSNSLSGNIPRSLENLSYLRHVNVSFNHLEGEIPSGGAFANSSAQSFMGNTELCGLPRLQVPPCASNTPRGSRLKKLFLNILIPVIASVIFAVALVYLWMMRRRKKGTASEPVELLQIMTHQMVSYHELQQATDNFNQSNLLGIGGYGSVFKGTLSDGTVVAVKVLNLPSEEACKSFDAECAVMRGIRHRNLVKIITTCSNEELRALVLQYMPNGSLHNWLHKQNYNLDLLQRINIMLDVAMAMEYLHHDVDDPVVHCDLKPSNVLLDEDMVAHVSDFGISKIVAEDRLNVQTKTLGTIGYIAPEYGSGGIVSICADVYSYGIMMMETFTKRKPTDEMLENSSLKQWVIASFPTAVMEIVDANLFQGEDEISTKQKVCVVSVIELALDCTRETPEERINMKDVTVRLKKIKQRLFGPNKPLSTAQERHQKREELT